MEQGSFQRCPLAGQRAMGTKWSTGSSIWTWGITYFEGDRVLEQAAWGGCRVSVAEDTQNPPEHFPMQPTAGNCFSREIELDDLQRSLPTLTILWFCNFVISLHISWSIKLCGGGTLQSITYVQKNNQTLLLIHYKSCIPIFVMCYRFFFRSLDLNCSPLTLIG